jgi:hypothetical protein
LVVNDILSGRFDIHHGGIKSGPLGTHATTLWRLFRDRGTLINNIWSMLDQNWWTQNYIGKYFMSSLPSLVETAEQRAYLIEGLSNAAKNDARIVINNLEDLPRDWCTAVYRKAGMKRPK